VYLLLDDGRSPWPTFLWREHMQTAVNIIGDNGYVTQLVRLDDLDPAKWQLFLDLYANWLVMTLPMLQDKLLGNESRHSG
jgi:hypothetical protein